MINPDMVVLSGHGIDGATPESILAICEKYIPKVHLPDLVIKPDYRDDCLDGMLALALDSLAYEVQMVERERT